MSRFLALVAVIAAAMLTQGVNAYTCSSASTINSCLNNPTYTCYWCSSYCTSTYYSSCTSSSCSGTSYSSTCTTSSYYSNCGWCSTPYSGYSNCQYSSDSYSTSQCNYGWTANTYNNGYSSCSSYTSSSSCTSSSLYCGWCSTPYSTYSNCQSSQSSTPYGCTSGWTPSNSNAAVAAVVGMAVGLMIFVIVAPIVCCLCIIGIVVYLVCRKPAQNTTVVMAGAGQPMAQPGYYQQQPQAGYQAVPQQQGYPQQGAYPQQYPPQQGAYPPMQQTDMVKPQP